MRGKVDYRWERRGGGALEGTLHCSMVCRDGVLGDGGMAHALGGIYYGYEGVHYIIGV